MARLDVLACMLPGKRLLPQISAIGLLLAALAPSPAGSAERRPIPLSVLPLKLLDTSNEPTDQSAQHAARLARMADSLAIDLTRSGLFQATAVSADHLLRSCPSGEAECLLRAAREEGAELIFVGVVHKSSTLILQLWARLVDARTGRDVLARDLNFRGDTDEAWQRAETFLVAQIRDAVALAR